MVSEEVIAAKPSKASGSKKVFSIPVGKLRSKPTIHGRGGSCSRSVNRSKYQNRLLKRNNRELAFALSKQKEKTKKSIDEHLRLTSLLHECKLKALGWEKKFKSNQHEFTDYRKIIKGHLKDAVRYSVLLTDSLKSVMMLTANEGATVEGAPVEVAGNNESFQKAETPNSSTSMLNPLRHRVNPMISGHTIKYPTINLKRVRLDEVEMVINERSTVEHPTENAHVSNSVDSAQSSNMSLSTCVEEDEEESHIRNVSVNCSSEVQEDSFRRRTVSFRNRTLDKDKQVWDLEVSDPNCTPKEMTRDSHKELSQHNRSSGSSEQLNVSKWECITVPEGLTKLRPVVALNDVSKFLHNSNSVNVLNMSLDNDKASPPLIPTDVEKENLPSNKIITESCRQKRLGSGSVQKRFKSINPVNDQNGEPNINCSSNLPDEPIKEPSREDDPLEGTSWMYPNLFPKGTKIGRGRGKRKEVLKKIHKHATRSKIDVNNRKKAEITSSKSDSNLRSGSSEHVVDDLDDKRDSIAEEDGATAILANVQQQESSLNLKGVKQKDYCNESLEASFKDMDKINDDIKKNLVVQSTPKDCSSDDQLAPKSSPSQLTLSHQLDSPDKSVCSSLSNISSDKSSTQENSRLDGSDNLEKESASPSIYAKLLSNAFVTVRVKRLVSLDENLTGNGNEEENKVNELPLPEQTQFSQEIFEGFDCQEISQSKAVANGFLSRNHLTSRESSRTLPDSSYSTNSEYISIESSENGYCDTSLVDSSARPKRRAAPKELKEPSLHTKLRRDTMEKKTRKKKRVPEFLPPGAQKNLNPLL